MVLPTVTRASGRQARAAADRLEAADRSRVQRADPMTRMASCQGSVFQSTTAGVYSRPEEELAGTGPPAGTGPHAMRAI
jgi:hypothetical protein